MAFGSSFQSARSGFSWCLAAVLCFQGGCQGLRSESGGPISSETVPTEQQFAELLGTLEEGWPPSLLKGLSSGMSPSEAASVIPGADRLDANGESANIAVSDPHGVERIKLEFIPATANSAARLAYGSLVFRKFDAAHIDQAYENLRRACEAKYGVPTSGIRSSREMVWGSDTSFARLLIDGPYMGPKFPVLTVSFPQ